jgi:hypothetical protein
LSTEVLKVALRSFLSSMSKLSDLQIFTNRLHDLEHHLSDPAFLRSEGLGNELGFFVFDFEPKFAPRVEAHVSRLKAKLEGDVHLRVLEINLFALVLEILKGRGFLERAFELEVRQGGEALIRALAPLLRPELLRACIADKLVPLPDLVLLTGVGAVWPLLRSHAILNNLHDVIDRTPLVMFYPGEYDGQALRLFGEFKDDNYYRAFPLLPRPSGRTS